jgi:cytochrome c biogenesis factor
MIIYITKSYLITLITYALWLLCSFICFSKDQFIFLDTLNRINTNLLYWDTGYFSWTNLAYIYMLLLPTIYLIFAFVPKRFYQNYGLLLVCTFLIILNLFVFLNVNFNTQVNFNMLTDKSNFLLSNSINKYHPLLLHVSLNYVLLNYIKCYKSVDNNKDITLLYTTVLVNILVFYNCLFTMLLGSWWAYQEGSWGGWWAWDPSEVMGLLLLLILIFMFHISNKASRAASLGFTFRLLALLLALVYFCLQSNFAITSHNFGFQNESNFFLKTYYCCAIVLLYGLLLTLFYNNFTLINTSKLLHYLKNTTFKYHILLIVTVTTIALLPLLTDILWKLFTINFINFSPNYSDLLNLTMLTLLVYFNSYPNLIFIFICVIPQWTFLAPFYFYLLLSIVVKLYFSLFSALHKLFLSLILLAIISSNYYFSSWLNFITSVNAIFLSDSATFYNLQLLDYPSIDMSVGVASLSTSLSKILLNSIPETPMFNLVACNMSILQGFISDNGRLPFLTNMFDSLTIYILELLIYMGLFLYVRAKNPQLIKC